MILQVVCESCTTEEYIWWLAAMHASFGPGRGLAVILWGLGLRRFHIPTSPPLCEGICLSDYLHEQKPADTAHDLSTTAAPAATRLAALCRSMGVYRRQLVNVRYAMMQAISKYNLNSSFYVNSFFFNSYNNLFLRMLAAML